MVELKISRSAQAIKDRFGPQGLNIGADGITRAIYIVREQM